MFTTSRRSFMKSSIVLGAGLSLGVAGCGGSSAGSLQSKTKFAVLSDPHVYDSSLGTSGEAFEDYLSHDRKMLLESVEILEEMVADFLTTDGLEFVIIPGDLTKDGERVCHEKMVSILKPLLEKKVLMYMSSQVITILIILMLLLLTVV